MVNIWSDGASVSLRNIFIRKEKRQSWKLAKLHMQVYLLVYMLRLWHCTNLLLKKNPYVEGGLGYSSWCPWSCGDNRCIKTVEIHKSGSMWSNMYIRASYKERKLKLYHSFLFDSHSKMMNVGMVKSLSIHIYEVHPPYYIYSRKPLVANYLVPVSVYKQT